MQRKVLIGKRSFQFEGNKYRFNIEHDNTKLYLNVFEQKDIPVICTRFTPLFNRIMDILSERYSSALARSLTTEDQLISDQARREFNIDFDITGIEDEVDFFVMDAYRSYMDADTAKRIYRYIKFNYPEAALIEYEGWFYVSKDMEGHKELRNKLLSLKDQLLSKLVVLEREIDNLNYKF
ncbi:hypothetical protein [Brevibacillus porteri]|uniref:hypothetical protein n=1 Tax=Brevibacillus porteri TaxID=2126350 RepID=UPI0036359115